MSCKVCGLEKSAIEAPSNELDSLTIKEGSGCACCAKTSVASCCSSNSSCCSQSRPGRGCSCCGRNCCSCCRCCSGAGRDICQGRTTEGRVVGFNSKIEEEVKPTNCKCRN